jgi:hypothetical protein
MQERRWQTVAIERPNGVYNLLHQRRDLSFIIGVYQRRNSRKRLGAVIFDAACRAETPRAGHIGAHAGRAAAGARRRPKTEQPLSEQALLRVYKSLMGAL